MADIKRLSQYLSTAYMASKVPDGSPLYEAWEELDKARLNGVKPHPSWRRHARAAREQGHLPWRT